MNNLINKKQVKNIYNLTMQNDGFSYPLFNKGFTYSTDDTIKVNSNDFTAFSHALNDIFAIYCNLPLSLLERASVGTWLDTSGVIHIDLSYTVDSQRLAIRCSKTFGQKAIYSVVDKRVIYV